MDQREIDAVVRERLNKMVGCFLGVIIGDAMGMPWEMMSRKEIMLATRGQGISGFSHPMQTKIKDTMHLEAGRYTDDWSLTRAVARSLVACGRFDLMHCIKEHLVELEQSDFGYGGSTKKNLFAIRDLAKGDWKTNPNFRLPKTEDLLGAGGGNGIAMKIAPLAIFFRNRHDDFLDATIKLAGVTHRDPEAMIAAYALGTIINQLYFTSIGRCGKDILKVEIAELIQNVINETLLVEHSLLGGQTQFSTALLEVGRMSGNGKIADIDLVCENIGTSCFCAESVPFSIAMFLRHPTDFRAAIIETINCGGDTDSNASMVGALAGVNCGVMAIPEVWRRFRPEYEEAGYLANQLHNVMYPSTAFTKKTRAKKIVKKK